MINTLKYKLLEMYYALREAKRTEKVVADEAYEEERIAANIIRLVHSIEKGLSIENPRPYFGIKKIMDIIGAVNHYVEKYDHRNMCVNMACEVLLKWINWHNENGFYASDFENTEHQILEMVKQVGFECGEIQYAGTQIVSKNDMQFCVDEIRHFFETRHSIRQFSGEKVDHDKLQAAISLAQTSPSACNRQGVRVYSIDSKKYVEDIKADLSGIGGFTDDVDMFLLITGKLSAYDKYEHNQYIVSAGIFAGYLSLTLHAYNIGACIIQRSTRLSDQWAGFSHKNGIPSDEQIVCMIGIGCLKEETVVPVSKRYDVDEIYRHLS